MRVKHLTNQVLLAAFLLSSALIFTACGDEVVITTDKEIEFDKKDCGLLELGTAAFTDQNTIEMFKDDEAREVSFDPSQRSFKTNAPLQVSINSDRKLALALYSPIAVKNVTVWAQIPGYPGYFKLAKIDAVPAFVQSTFALPLTDSTKLYETEAGKWIEIEANPHISPDAIKLKITSDDPYYKKLEKIIPDWNIYFSAYSEDGSWAYRILPAHMREAVAIALNLAYMYSTDTFAAELYSWQGRLLDNNGNPIDTKQLRQRVIDHSGLRFGHVSGVNGLGGGETFGLAEWCFLEHYADDKSVTHTIFHELGHCLGYSHDSNMTYGDAWTVLCGNVYEQMSRSRELPVYTRNVMRTRRSRARYGSDYYAASKYEIENNEFENQ